MPHPSPVALDRIGQVAIPVQDVARAAAFYRDVLGMRHLFDAPPGLSFFDCGGVRLMLARPEGEGAEGRPVLYYTVADLPATYDALVARGAPGTQAPHRIAVLGDRELWLAFVRDSEDNLLGLMSEVPVAATAPAGS